VLQPPSDQVDPLVEADEPSAGAGELRRRHTVGQPVADLDRQPGPGPPVHPHPDLGSGRVLAGVGQPFLDDPVGVPADPRRDRPQVGERVLQRQRHAGPPGLVDELRQVGQDGLRTLALLDGVAVGAQHADHLPQVLGRLEGGAADDAGGAGDLGGAGLGGELQRAGVQGQQRDPVGEHVVHLPGDPFPLQSPCLLDAELLPLLGLAGPLLERAHQQAPRPHQHAPGEQRGEQERHGHHRRPVLIGGASGQGEGAHEHGGEQPAKGCRDLPRAPGGHGEHGHEGRAQAQRRQRRGDDEDQRQPHRPASPQQQQRGASAPAEHQLPDQVHRLRRRLGQAADDEQATQQHRDTGAADIGQPVAPRPVPALPWHRSLPVGVDRRQPGGRGDLGVQLRPLPRVRPARYWRSRDSGSGRVATAPSALVAERWPTGRPRRTRWPMRRPTGPPETGQRGPERSSRNDMDRHDQPRRAGATTPRGQTVVAEPRWWRVLVWIGIPLLGLPAGWLLESVASWVASLPWVPFQGPFKLVASVPEPHATIGALVVGGLAGLVLATLAALDRLTVTVADDQVAFTRGGVTRAVTRALVGAVFLDGKQLVLLGPATEELARETSDLQADRLEDAFVVHGFPWRADGDPYRDEYQRWVDDGAGLPAGANALLKARARALDKGDGDDAAELRTELARLGVVVRDQRKRQYWRRSGRSLAAPADPTPDDTRRPS
jgi:hypothetical protein